MSRTIAHTAAAHLAARARGHKLPAQVIDLGADRWRVQVTIGPTETVLLTDGMDLTYLLAELACAQRDEAA